MKYILFSIAAAGVIPAAFFMVYDRRLLRITAFLIPLCALAFQQTAINFFSHELYRGTSRGMEVSLSYLCALVILLAILMRRGRLRLLPGAGSWLYCAYFLSCLVSTLNADSLLYSFFELWKMVMIYLVFLAVWNYLELTDDVELLGAGREFDLEEVRAGRLSPVFFGSALTNFGVEPFLKEFLRLTPTPLPRKDAQSGELVEPCSEQFSGFIFKIQANMNKNHRDRIAFLRICSGKFERGMEAFHVQEGKNIKLATGTSLMADDRAIVSEAYAGDIIGLFDPGIFSIGDTLCTGKKHVQFAGIPTFAPEHFARVTQVDTMKRKQFVKGMEQIAQEGAIQIFRDLGAGMEEVIVGVVGVLQLEVLEYRLKNEYNVDIRMQTLPYEHLRWVLNDPEELDIKHLDVTSDTRAIEDMKGNPLLLFGSPWSINWAEQHNEALKLSEFGNLTF